MYQLKLLLLLFRVLDKSDMLILQYWLIVSDKSGFSSVADLAPPSPSENPGYTPVLDYDKKYQTK